MLVMCRSPFWPLLIPSKRYKEWSCAGDGLGQFGRSRLDTASMWAKHHRRPRCARSDLIVLPFGFMLGKSPEFPIFGASH